LLSCSPKLVDQRQRMSIGEDTPPHSHQLRMQMPLHESSAAEAGFVFWMLADFEVRKS
jgi:hypothetical protein